MTTNQHQDDVILAYEPDLSIQQLLGDGVQFQTILTPELRQACQKLIDEARDAFFDEEKHHVEKIKALAKEGSVSVLPQISDIAHEIKVQARMFGFTFISNLCEQIINFAQLPGKSVEVRFMVISRFVDALYIAMIQRMRDEGGELEKELNLSVEYLSH